MNTALLTGWVQPDGVQQGAEPENGEPAASDEANELLSPFLAGTEEEDLHTSPWDDEDDDGFVLVKSRIDNRETMTPMH